MQKLMVIIDFCKTQKYSTYLAILRVDEGPELHNVFHFFNKSSQKLNFLTRQSCVKTPDEGWTFQFPSVTNNFRAKNV